MVVKSRPVRRQDTLKIELKYGEDRQSALTQLKRISKPGLRVYSKAQDIPLVMGGVATVIVSTSQGLMTGRAAYRKHLGGRDHVLRMVAMAVRPEGAACLE